MAKNGHKTAEKTKTVASKTVEKVKAPATKSINKEKAAKCLAKVPEEVVFWCHDGQVFRDLNDLMCGFDLMTEDTFCYHANEEKNDFSCWIVDILGDEELAKDVKKAKTPKQAKKITEMRYSDLTRLEA